jgi:regulator of nucleoside diphosphate kinase
MTAPNAGPNSPEIHLSESDYDLIADLALRMRRGAPELSNLALDEIDRAQLHPDGELPGEIVAIGSEVEFDEEGNGPSRRVILVLPAEADIEAGKVSVMTSVGLGLIGLRAGQVIEWPRPDGSPRTLRIKSVRCSNVG